ncbi:NAD(P)-binding protein [Auriculariales sp. MPI-PUGE-AT-0066]|nr:NAD(P)-binding protein [Auriculariales sp. MPI-PUGE-AT-0066]
MSSADKPIIVIAGVGAGFGTGGSVAREFGSAGYRVALLARTADAVNQLANKLTQDNIEAKAFPVAAYDHQTLHAAFASIRTAWPNVPIRVAVWNAGDAVWKPFLDISPEEVKKGTDSTIGAFAFSREAILAFKDLELDSVGKRGALIFTSATSALRGNKTTSVFSASKFALRSLSQSLAKEFGKQNIHVSTVIIDGGILTDRSAGRGEEYAKNDDVRLNPDSIAKSYFYLANQDRSAWTWEIDLRPAHETW